MFGRVRIRSPSNGGNVASGQVTLLRQRSDDVRVVLSTLSNTENQAFIASARASSKSSFSIDVVRANAREPWEQDYITVNWFVWPKELDKKARADIRGSFALNNASRIDLDRYEVFFDTPLENDPVAVIASARNENRAQVIVVNVVGSPTRNSFVIRAKRVDDSRALIEDDGTYVDWIIPLPVANHNLEDSTNRTGRGTYFKLPFPSTASGLQLPQKVFVIHAVNVPLGTRSMYASSVLFQTNRYFTTSRLLTLRGERDSSVDSRYDRDIDSSTPTFRNLEVSALSARKSIMYFAWAGTSDECETDSACAQRGTCLFVSGEMFPLLSQCACRSPWSGFQCDEQCPGDETGTACSGNGFCEQKLPQCECFSGWTGEFCASKAYSADSRLVLMSFLGIIAVLLVCFCVWFSLRCRTRRSRERKLLDLRRALIGSDSLSESFSGSNLPRERFEQIEHVLNADASSWAIPFEKLVFGAQIGQGSSSQVFIGLYASQTVAIKKMAVPRQKRKPHESELDLWLYFKREAGFLATLHHPNVVRFFGVSSQLDYREHRFTDYFYIITELCICCLTDLIRGPILCRPPHARPVVEFTDSRTASREPLPVFDPAAALFDRESNNSDDEGLEEMSSFVFRLIFEVAQGMEFLHSKSVVHRDLKCDNVLLDSHNRVKLCDFGISRVVDHTKGYIQGTTAMVATPAFMAPELITTGGFPCGTKVDVYSFGIVLWAFINWREPYVELQQMFSVYDLMSAITNKGLRPSVNDLSWPDSLQRLFTKCVDSNPNNRPTFADILEQFGDRNDSIRADIKLAWMNTYRKHAPLESRG